jgi:hypothetical protein
MGRNWKRLAVALLAASVLACGGDIVGVGNSGNRFFVDELDQLAESLHHWPGVPQVAEQDLVRIYQALVQRAREGDPQAARVVLGLAEMQRAARKDD